MSTTAIETDLDTDISTLKSRISTLQSHRANLHAILLSQPHLSTRLSSNTPPSSSSSSNSKIALDLISQQTRRNQENIYRACAGVTAYKVQDPDPHAVNSGAVLGVRVDVSVGSKFIETYHVLLNWSEEEGEAGEKKKKVLRIHRHTVPPCIAVQQLAGRWLPSSRGKGVSEGDEATESPEQDLVKFGRALRKELVSWHLRIKTVRDLREEAGLSIAKEQQHGQKKTSLESAGQVLNAFTSDDEEEEEEEENLDAEEPRDEGNSSRILDIEADAAVRQVTVTWANRRTAIMVITKDGRVEKAVSRTKDGVRDVALSRRAIGPLAGLVRRLTA